MTARATRAVLTSLLLLAELGCDGPAPGGAPAAGADPSRPTDPSTACDPLRPTYPPAVEVSFSFPEDGTGAPSRTCWNATTSPGGQVALAFFVSGSQVEDQIELRLYTPAGVEQTAASSRIARLGAFTTLDMPWFHASALGWHGIVHDGSPLYALAAWDGLGGRMTRLTGFASTVDVTPDGHGGSVAITADLESTGQASALVWVSAAGEVVRTVTLDRDGTLAIVHPATRDVLVFASSYPDNVVARWFGADGAPLTDWFDARFQFQGQVLLTLLLDGRPAIFDGIQWVAAYRAGTTAVDAPPAWLAARAGMRIAALPGGRGYLALGGSDWFDASPAAELLTRDGESCGFLQPPPGAAPSEGARAPVTYWLGEDGTLIESAHLDGPLLAEGIHCAFRWWPGLLRR